MAFFTGGAPGPVELLIILFVILLLFGGKKLPGLARSLGRSLSEFKRGKEEGAKMIDDALKDEPSEPERPADPAPAAEDETPQA